MEGFEPTHPSPHNKPVSATELHNFKLSHSELTPMLVNSQPHAACFLICSRELYGSDRPIFGTIVKRIKNGIDWDMSSNHYAN